MNEMIERVARAICTAREQNGGPPWEYWEYQPGGKHVLNAFRDDARAAIAAMREPTTKMVEDAYYSALAEDAKGVWRDMIDAALTGDTK